MTKLVEFDVARVHLGDKITDDGSVVHRFEPGETRLATPADVKHLVDLGVLKDPASKVDGADTASADQSSQDEKEPAVDTKANDTPAANKAEPAAKNKAEPKPANKTGTAPTKGE